MAAQRIADVAAAYISPRHIDLENWSRGWMPPPQPIAVSNAVELGTRALTMLFLGPCPGEAPGMYMVRPAVLRPRPLVSGYQVVRHVRPAVRNAHRAPAGPWIVSSGEPSPLQTA